MHLVWSDLIVLTLIYFILTSGLNLIIGYARALSVHHAALFALGAFTYSTMSTHHWSHDLIVVVLVAAALAGLVSLLLAIGSLRIAGDYFIIASLAFQVLAVNVLFNWKSVSGGTFGVYGLDAPTVLGLSVGSATAFIVVALAFALVTLGLVIWLARGPFGRVARAMGQSESAVSAAGFSALRVRASTFVLAGTLAGVAGVVYSSYIGIAYANDYGINLSIQLAAMVVIGGAGSAWGSLLGAAVLAFTPSLLTTLNLNQDIATSVQQLVFAGLLIGVMLVLPEGLAGLPRRLVRAGARALRLHKGPGNVATRIRTGNHPSAGNDRPQRVGGESA